MIVNITALYMFSSFSKKKLVKNLYRDDSEIFICMTRVYSAIGRNYSHCLLTVTTKN